MKSTIRFLNTEFVFVILAIVYVCHLNLGKTVSTFHNSSTNQESYCQSDVNPLLIGENNQIQNGFNVFSVFQGSQIKEPFQRLTSTLNQTNNVFVTWFNQYIAKQKNTVLKQHWFKLLYPFHTFL